MVPLILPLELLVCGSPTGVVVDEDGMGWDRMGKVWVPEIVEAFIEGWLSK